METEGTDQRAQPERPADPPLPSGGTPSPTGGAELASDEASATGYPLHFSRPSPVDYPRSVVDVEPVGGKIRVFAEDFEVTEIPLYPFCGRGEHCYVTVVKTNRTTLEVAEYFARSLGLKSIDVGFAGFKDRRAVARQTFSLMGVHKDRVWPLETSWLHIADVTYHQNKLRTGHLRGNRFRIRIRGVQADALARARAILARLHEVGVPNFYGPQRFGRFGDNYEVGCAMLHRNPQAVADHLLAPRPGAETETFRARYHDGDYEGALAELPPGRPAEAGILHGLRRREGSFRVAVRRIPRELKRMFYSAYQSFLFNWCLRERLEWAADAHGTIWPGDLAFLHAKGACFGVGDGGDDLDDARRRARAGELSPSGPIFGRKMIVPRGREGDLEQAVLAAEKLRPGSFLSHVKGIHLDGSRRPYRVPLDEVEVVEEREGEETHLVVSFALPPGSYATIPLREIMGVATDEEPLPTAGDDATA
ncbi:MAG: tRNA pseudouridine(13) synthase TruD [Planctomycetota bacterium]